ncbi:hypothetical protein NVSP9465_03555 [Novosphingobium sp. CECT 9465]|nr:hypothetical protein NVSP9465_03555 [Novosphingobium sp. CECT 9465]
MPIAKICSMLGISKPKLYAYVRSAETKPVSRVATLADK